MLRAAVGHPSAVWSQEAAFCCNDDLFGIAVPSPDCLRDEPLVVPSLTIIETICIGRIEKHGAGIKCGVNDGNAMRGVSRLGCREPHTAEAECTFPVRHHICSR